MKAIETKYLGCTNSRGSRIKAIAEGGDRPHSVTLSYDHELNGDENHEAAAWALVIKMGWTWETMFGGGTRDGMAWICGSEYSESKRPKV